MSTKKKDKCTIREEELSKWLSISIDELDEIVDFFDSDPDDDWDLVEGDDYKFTNRIEKIRIYSPAGALKIATYLDQQKRGLWHDIVEFITRHEKRLRNSLARRLINGELAENGKIVPINGYPMMHKQSLRRILETSGGRFNKAFKDIEKSPLPLQKRVDYDDISGDYWFAATGAERIAKELGQKLKNKARREMCLSVGGQIKPSLKLLENAQKDREQKLKKEIANAKQRAKRRDKYSCQITGRQRSAKPPRCRLTAHHLYCAKQYPHLVAHTDNLITIEESIHEQFHGWMGGTDKICTLDDFLKFIHSCYAEEPRIEILSAKLHQLKEILKVEDDK